MKTELKYRTFNELLGEISTDFAIYNNEGLIEPAQLIKIAQKVNYDLGLRINGTKERILEIEHRKVRLPDDFYVLNYAYLAHTHTVTYRANSGRHTENIITGYTGDGNCPKCYKPEVNCCCEATYVQECQNGEKIFVQVVEKRKMETRTYESFERIRISSDTGRSSALHEGHNHPHTEHLAYIKNGFLYTNIEHGNIFISYQGALEDDEGNLLVLDHPMINEYYEYAIKQRLLENLYINGEDVAQKLQLIEQRLRPARNNALTIVNTPNFAEMYDVWRMNRRAMYARYYDMFKSYDNGNRLESFDNY